MSDEVRSNSSPAPPGGGGSPIDSVDGPKSLDIEFPTPDLELGDAPPDSGPKVTPHAPVTVLHTKDISRPEVVIEPLPPRPLPERPPLPPSQRNQRTDGPATPVPPPPGAVTLPAPAPLTTLPAPAALPGNLGPVPPYPGVPSPATLGPVVEPSLPVQRRTPAPPPGDAPPARMLSEPVPLVQKVGGSTSPPKSTLRPGLVEPKRIIEVLGSNVPVLDTALEEDGIEDLDESEAHELAETPVPDAPSSEPELEVNVVIEDFPSSIDVSLEETPAPPLLSDAPAARPARAPQNGEAAPSSPDAAHEPPEGPPGKRPPKAPPNKRKRPPPPSSRSSDKLKLDLTTPPARKWWEEMFSEEFLRAIPILSPRQLEREVRFIDEALAVNRGGRILDLACGAGQHAVELATRGYDLVGFDLSQSQLDWAGGLAQERNQRLQFTYGDMRDLTYNESFDAVYSWNTSFGFFEEEKNVDVLTRIFRALRPGGRFLLDVINRDFVVAQQPGQTWFEGDGCVCIDDVSIDFITSRMKVKRTLMLTNGKNRECNYSVRIYGLHELGKMLHDVGFKVLNVSGRPEMPGVFFGATSPRIIILASKPG
jgi:SAM-dependent methyltransferase